MKESPWPYNLPIWRRSFQASSPDGKLIARIDPAYEVSMGNPTSGMLCVSLGLHISRCNPSFVWSDDSKYLAVPQYFDRLGIFRRQRLVVIAMGERQAYASNATAWYFQPETFIVGTLVVAVNPHRSGRKLAFEVPTELDQVFRKLPVAWPVMSHGETN